MGLLLLSSLILGYNNNNNNNNICLVSIFLSRSCLGNSSQNLFLKKKKLIFLNCLQELYFVRLFVKLAESSMILYYNLID